MKGKACARCIKDTLSAVGPNTTQLYLQSALEKLCADCKKEVRGVETLVSPEVLGMPAEEEPDVPAEILGVPAAVLAAIAQPMGGKPKAKQPGIGTN